MCDFAAILNAFRDQLEPRTTKKTPAAHHARVAHPARFPGPILEGARVSNAAAHTCAAAAGFFCYAHTGRYPKYLYSYRYL